MKMRLHYGIFIDYLVFLLVRLLEVVFNLIPHNAAFAFGRFIGRLVWVLFSDRRAAALENLNIAFGRERSQEWITSTARKSFEHVGLMAIEFLLIRRWTQKNMAEKIVLQGKLPYDLSTMPGNHGILLLNSHFGCFEVSAATTKFLGLRVNLIATGLKNPFLSRYFESRAGGEEETGIRFFPHKGSVKALIGYSSREEWWHAWQTSGEMWSAGYSSISLVPKHRQTKSSPSLPSRVGHAFCLSARSAGMMEDIRASSET